MNRGFYYGRPIRRQWEDDYEIPRNPHMIGVVQKKEFDREMVNMLGMGLSVTRRVTAAFIGMVCRILLTKRVVSFRGFGRFELVREHRKPCFRLVFYPDKQTHRMFNRGFIDFDGEGKEG